MKSWRKKPKTQRSNRLACWKHPGKLTMVATESWEQLLDVVGIFAGLNDHIYKGSEVFLLLRF